jgi:hypothetical protein
MVAVHGPIKGPTPSSINQSTNQPTAHEQRFIFMFISATQLKSIFKSDLHEVHVYY